MCIRIWFFFSILIFSLHDNALSQVLEFDHFSEKQGLLDNNITSIIKDKTGFIWVGTIQGLDRFDGYSCKHFLYETDNPNSLIDNNVSCLLASDNDKIYIGTYGEGFSIYDKPSESFENYSHNKLKRNSLSHDTVLSFCEDRQGKIWIGTNSGLDKFDPLTKEFTRFFPFEKETKTAVSSMALDIDGNLWLYGPANKPCKFNTKSYAVYYLSHKSLNTSPTFRERAALMLDEYQNLWFGNDNVGLYKYDLKTQELKSIKLQSAEVKNVFINSITEDEAGNIWIGTEGAGLYQYNFLKGNVINYHSKSNLFNNISSNTISCVMESKPGILWIGNHNSGLNILREYKRKFEKIGVNENEGRKLNNPSILSIYPYLNGKLIFGTDGGGLNIYNPANHVIQHFSKENYPLTHNTIKSLYVENDGTIWYGAPQSGLCTINLNTGLSVSYRKEMLGNANEGSKNCAWVLCKSSNNKLYIGLLQGGIKIYDLERRVFEQETILPANFQKIINSCRIMSMYEDRDKRIWIGTEFSGVICYDPNTRKYYEFHTIKEDSTALKGDLVKVIYQDRAGTIWVGTKGGLNKLVDFGKRKFIHYTIDNGLPSNNIKCIVEDKAGNLWLSSSKGISCFNVKKNVFKNFDEEDGISGSNFHSHSSYQTKEGLIYMGGSDGLTIFHPDSIVYDTAKPSVVITDFKVFEQSISSHVALKNKKYLDTSLLYTKKIELDPSDNIFSVEFAALDYLCPQKNTYAFKLEGFNDTWTYVNAHKRTATYTNLNPGTYVFTVIGSNADGFWNNTGTSLTIVIPPPYYMTWWFRGLGALFLTVVLFSFYYSSRARSIKRRNTVLKREVAKQTMELNEMNEELRQTAEELLIQNNKSNTLYQELTEGLEAAKLIQNSILPGKDLLEKEFGQISILFRPKELVSGDFYWFTKVDNKLMLAAVDCTGHGVAGAFMTFVGYEILNQIARISLKADPGVLISLLNQEIISSMNHYSGSAVNAGMDAAVCVIDPETHTLFFAGANNPLYLVRGKELLVFKGDRQGVGGKQKRSDYLFRTHTINIEPGDQFYIFSDGYADQMGGENGAEKFMYNRLRDTLLRIQPYDVKNRINKLGEKFDAWKGACEQLDDVLVIAFEYTPAKEIG